MAYTPGFELRTPTMRVKCVGLVGVYVCGQVTWQSVEE